MHYQENEVRWRIGAEDDRLPGVHGDEAQRRLGVPGAQQRAPPGQRGAPAVMDETVPR